MKSVVILGRRYAIRKKAMDKKTYGSCKGIDGVITLNSKHDAETLPATLVHEAIHAIFHESGLTKMLDKQEGLEEALCTTLEGGLIRAGLIRDDLFA